MRVGCLFLLFSWAFSTRTRFSRYFFRLFMFTVSWHTATTKQSACIVKHHLNTERECVDEFEAHLLDCRALCHQINSRRTRNFIYLPAKKKNILTRNQQWIIYLFFGILSLLNSSGFNFESKFIWTASFQMVEWISPQNFSQSFCKFLWLWLATAERHLWAEERKTYWKWLIHVHIWMNIWCMENKKMRKIFWHKGRGGGKAIKIIIYIHIKLEIKKIVYQAFPVIFERERVFSAWFLRKKTLQCGLVHVRRFHLWILFVFSFTEGFFCFFSKSISIVFHESYDKASHSSWIKMRICRKTCGL